LKNEKLPEIVETVLSKINNKGTERKDSIQSYTLINDLCLCVCVCVRESVCVWERERVCVRERAKKIEMRTKMNIWNRVWYWKLYVLR